jgi:Tfp pilus assembly protein PilO
MNEKRLLKWIGAGAGLALAGLGYLIYAEYGALEIARQNVADIRGQIDTARKQLSGLAALEKDVIVLRETEQAIKDILPDDKDLNNFVRDLQDFAQDTEVSFTQVKKKDLNAGAKKAATDAFEKVAYEISLEGDAFQALAFLDRVESHTRFLRVPTIALTASTRRAIEERGVPRHKVKLEIETFVYKPQAGVDPVKIESYSRKRELLLGEIAKRRQALAVQTYQYRGPRGRRDPWVDPRVPTTPDDPTALPIGEQQKLVDGLVERMVLVKRTLEDWRATDVIVRKMMLRAELDQLTIALEEDTRRVQAEGLVRFAMAERRMQVEVVDQLAALRDELDKERGPVGPSVEMLTQVAESMSRHISSGEPALAIETFKSVEGSLGSVSADPERRALARQIVEAFEDAKILRDFQAIAMQIKGVAIQEGRPPVALINGRTLREGDLFGDEMVVRSIRSGEIEFLFRGVVLVRRF